MHTCTGDALDATHDCSCEIGSDHSVRAHRSLIDERNRLAAAKDEQRATDLSTIRAHLARGTDPSSGQQPWGNFDWAVYRTIEIDDLKPHDSQEER